MVVPFFTSVIPTGISVLFPFFKITIFGLGILCVTAFLLIPLLSPLTTIFFVDNYRQHLYSILLPRKFQGKISIQHNTIGISTIQFATFKN